MTRTLDEIIRDHDRTDWREGRHLPPGPAMWCRHCLYPLASHVDGVCQSGWEEETFAYLPLGTDANVRDVADSSGDSAFLFWVADCYDPPIYLARGESFADACEWFLAGLIDAGSLTDQHDEILRQASETADKYNADAREYVASEGERGMPGYEWIDGYPGIYYTETVDGRQIAGTDRG